MEATSTTRNLDWDNGNKKNVNVGKMERWASVLGGAALAALALKRRNKATLGLALAGAPLLWRGATGHCSIYERMGIDRSSRGQESEAGHETRGNAGDPLLHGSTASTGDATGGNGRSPLATGLPASESGRDPIGASF